MHTYDLETVADAIEGTDLSASMMNEDGTATATESTSFDYGDVTLPGSDRLYEGQRVAVIVVCTDDTWWVHTVNPIQVGVPNPGHLQVAKIGSGSQFVVRVDATLEPPSGWGDDNRQQFERLVLADVVVHHVYSPRRSSEIEF